MDDVKVIYKIEDKEFEDFEEAMDYKEELESKRTRKHELIKNIAERYKAVQGLIDEYTENFDDDESIEELINEMGLGDIEDTIENKPKDDTVHIRIGTRSADEVMRDLTDALKHIYSL